jgi:hypothetical protein
MAAKLIYKRTGVRVCVGDHVVLRDGVQAKVTGIAEPHKPSSTGRVYVNDGTHEHSFFPCVIEARWVGRTDQGE